MGTPRSDHSTIKFEEAFRGVLDGEDPIGHLVVWYNKLHYLSSGDANERALATALNLIITLTKKGILTVDEAVEMLLEKP